MADHKDQEAPTYDDRPYFWWDGSDLSEFFGTVNRYGYDNVRIEVRETGEGEEREAFIDVYLKKGNKLVGHYNFSHICPPNCH